MPKEISLRADAIDRVLEVFSDRRRFAKLDSWNDFRYIFGSHLAGQKYPDDKWKIDREGLAEFLKHQLTFTIAEEKKWLQLISKNFRQIEQRDKSILLSKLVRFSLIEKFFLSCGTILAFEENEILSSLIYSISSLKIKAADYAQKGRELSLQVGNVLLNKIPLIKSVCQKISPDNRIEQALVACQIFFGAVESTSIALENAIKIHIDYLQRGKAIEIDKLYLKTLLYEAIVDYPATDTMSFDANPELFGNGDTLPTYLVQIEEINRAIFSCHSGGKIGRYGFAFGRGERTCPGKGLAVLELTKMLSYLLQRYRFTCYSSVCRSCGTLFSKSVSESDSYIPIKVKKQN